MGQCSSTSKQQRNKTEALERFDSPALDEDETSDEQGDIVEPQLSGPRQQRRAIDERARRDGVERKQAQDFGLTALRPSLDDNTCAALLALRMGRGSSVGGILNTTGSIASGENVVTSVEGCSPRVGSKAVDSGKSGVPQRPSLLSKPTRSSTSESNERLEKLLACGEGGSAPSVPPIPAQS
ncbi:hypothetical protein PLESTB_001001200 [Pleodorina starrii]|uniref:Uncharacterized protein n=1 Tax=Pleodorina starrii TaxID=330485 RepID=A0A9W6BPT7_9CHLO|nr:hypothetical protein PLESTM_001206200 [Pleodorina starrii]GLC55567.1 hypothetical protein PLESTB_001001200 [Pleodorina starrii]GLC65317.1 hypothetical protein PLESTF_000279700 [Pleodorina starrii]